MLTITHNHEAGTLVDGTTRNDGTAPILKAHRFRWGHTIGAWYLPNSRDRFANTYAITTTADALRATGVDVAISIDDTARPVSQAEADRAARLDQRAAALTTKAQRATTTANNAQARADNAHQSLPEWGEPIKVGHHSEKRHRAAIAKAHTTMRQAIDTAADAHELARKADIAAAANDRRNDPVTVANRIAKVAAELRRLERMHATATASQPLDHPGAADSHAAYLERLENMRAHAADTLTHWTQVREAQLAEGLAPAHSRATIAPGDQVKISGTWWVVKRANAKSVGVDGGHGCATNAPYHQITEHRPASK